MVCGGLSYSHIHCYGEKKWASSKLSCQLISYMGARVTYRCGGGVCQVWGHSNVT